MWQSWISVLISSLCALHLPVSILVHLCLTLPSSPPLINHSSISLLFPPPTSLSYPCCLVKMTEYEDMMEYFLSSLWISLLTDPHAHTASKAHTPMHTHTERPIHHIKVSWVSAAVMSLISVGYQQGDWYTLKQSTDRTFTRYESRIWKSASLGTIAFLLHNSGGVGMWTL